MEKLEKPTIYLSLTSTDYSVAVMEKYKNKAKADNLGALMPVYLKLKNADIRISPDTPHDHALLFQKFLNDPNKLRAPEILGIISWLNSSLSNIKEIADKLAPEVGKVWLELINDTFVSILPRVQNIMGRKVEVFVSNYRSSDPMTTEAWFALANIRSYHNYYYWSARDMIDSSLYLTPKIRRLAADTFLGPGSADLQSTKSLPTDENLSEDDFEEFLPSDMMHLLATFQNGDMFSKSGKITGAKMHSIGAKLSSPGFAFEEGYIPKRKKLLILAYSKFAMQAKAKGIIATEGADPAAFAKYVVMMLPYRLSDSDFNTFLPMFKSFTKSWASESRAASLVNLISIFLITNPDDWIDMSHFPLALMCAPASSITSDAYPRLFPQSATDKATITFTDDDFANKRDYEFDPWKDLSLAFSLAWIRLLCAVGILETLSDPNAETREPDDLFGLRFVRLTSLGKFAFSLADSYAATPSDAGSFDLDDTNHIITASNPDSPYVMILENMAEKISPSRFKISPTTIIAKAPSKEEVETRLENLTKFICPVPSPSWKALIEETRKRCEILVEDRTVYKLYHLDKDTPGLIDFISRNEAIRKYSIRAENFMLLVRKTNDEEFRRLLKDNGYML